jgi:hypothetical protein
LDALAHRFQKGIKVKDRKYHNTTFQNVFTGVEAVDWLVENWPKKLSRAQAVWLGNLLMRTNSFSHVTKSFPFMDKEYFYRFHVRPPLERFANTFANANALVLVCGAKRELCLLTIAFFPASASLQADERESSFNVMKALQPFVGQLALSRTGTLPPCGAKLSLQPTETEQ